MDKPSTATLEAYSRVFPHDDPRAVRRPMFGMDAGTVNGNFFAGVFGDGFTLRLPEERVQQIVHSHEGVFPFTPMGRRWKGYALADAATWGGRPELERWVREALDHTASLPAKEKKPKTKAAPKARKGRTA
jgi:TfoX/Sxy family transcriptional regulator of competence genes